MMIYAGGGILSAVLGTGVFLGMQENPRAEEVMTNYRRGYQLFKEGEDATGPEVRPEYGRKLFESAREQFEDAQKIAEEGDVVPKCKSAKKKAAYRREAVKAKMNDSSSSNIMRITHMENAREETLYEPSEVEAALNDMNL